MATTRKEEKNRKNHDPICSTAGWVTFKSDAIAGNAGVTLVEDSGLINTNELMAKIAFHFLIGVQFSGSQGRLRHPRSPFIASS